MIPLQLQNRTANERCQGLKEKILTELSIPRVRSMMKNTTAQNVDPERVEIASGYRMKTKPAPEIGNKN